MYERIRRACHVEGMSIREASRVFGVHRQTVRKILQFSLPPGTEGSDCVVEALSSPLIRRKTARERLAERVPGTSSRSQ